MGRVQVYIWAEEGVCEVRSEKCILRNKQKRNRGGVGGALGSGGPEHEILKNIQQTDTLN